MGGELMTQYRFTVTEDEVMLLEDLLAYAREHFEADDDTAARDFLNTADLLLMKLALTHASEITEAHPRTTTTRPMMVH